MYTTMYIEDIHDANTILGLADTSGGSGSEYDDVRFVDAIRGVDTNPGTFAQPFRTITGALQGIPLAATVTIRLLPGIHQPATQLDISHTNLTIMSTDRFANVHIGAAVRVLDGAVLFERVTFDSSLTIQNGYTTLHHCSVGQFLPGGSTSVSVNNCNIGQLDAQLEYGLMEMKNSTCGRLAIDAIDATVDINNCTITQLTTVNGTEDGSVSFANCKTKVISIAGSVVRIRDCIVEGTINTTSTGTVGWRNTEFDRNSSAQVEGSTFSLNAQPDSV